MASNISVAITVDNKQYIAGVRAADAATQKFSKDTTANLGRVSQSFDVLGKRILGLRTVLVGLTFGAVGRSALTMSDNLSDLSASSNIAVASLIELQTALGQAGGQADQMPTAVNKLLQSIDEAASGSIKAQMSFAKLGISLQELGTLSEQDLLVETLKGIAALPSATERASAMMDKFGKSFKTVDAATMLSELEAVRGTGDRYAASIERAAKLNDLLAKSQNNLKLALIDAFSKPLAQLNTFFENVNNGTQNMDKLVTAIKVVGIALATAFAVSGALALVTVIGQIGRAITVVLGLSTGMAGIFAATGSFMVGLRGAAVLAAAMGTSIYAASQLFDNFGDIAANALARIVEAMGRFAASILNLPTDAMAGFLKMIGVKVDNPFGLGDGINKLVDQAKNARLEAEKTQQALNARRDFAATDPRRVKPDQPVAGGRVIDTTAQAQAIAGVKEISAEYEKQLRLNLSKIDLETRLVGIGEDVKQLTQEQIQLAEKYSDIQDQLIKKRQSLGKDEQYLAATINEQIKKNAEGFNAQFAAITKSVTAQQTAKKLEEDRLYFIDLQTKSMNTILDIQANIASISMSEDDRKIAALQRQIKLEEDAAVKREQGRLGATPITAEAEAAIREKVRKSTEGQLDAQLKLNAATKAESARLFVQDLQNTAIANTISLQAELAKLTMTADQQRILDLQTQNKLLVQQEVAKRNALLKPGETIAASEIAQITAQVTAANQGFINSTQALIDKSREFSTGYEQAFVKYKDDALNAATQSKTYFETFTKGFEDAFVKFVQTGKLSFKDLANSIIADFVRIQAKQALLGMFGGGGGGGGFLSSLFGGFFANGGMPPVGKPSIVGERGPELFVPQSAGKIIPNHALGGGGNVVNNTTEVSYNISAVDAQSFKSLLARDPEFIHNVAEQGRRSLPIRSRR